MAITEHVLDFETASGLSLKEAGPWRYAEDPTTEVLCLVFEIEPDRRMCWTPNGVYTGMLMSLAANRDVMFVSHGDFERAIWRCIMVPDYGFPDIPNERWQDTMAVCAQKQLPLGLELALKVLGAPFEKDREGSAHTVALSKTNRKTGMLDRSPAALQRTYTYCDRDVEQERWVLNRVGHLQRGERRVWLLDQTINQRGVRLDIPYIQACQKVVDGALVPLDKEFAALTGGLRITQRDKIMAWIAERTDLVPDLKKETIASLIGKGIEDDEDDDDGEGISGSVGLGDDGRLPALVGDTVLRSDIRRVLSIRQTAGSASVKKLGRMLACVSGDGRARGLLQYHRAGPGRWAGRLLQPQNFPRPTLKDEHDKPVPPEEIVRALMTGDWEWVEMMCGPAIQTVVSGLRHALVPDRGKIFLSGDYAQIEARIVLALAGQYDKCDVFAKFGSAIYIDMACDIFRLPKPDYTNKADVKRWKEEYVFEYVIGKNTILGAGFGMGAPTFLDRYCGGQSLEFALRAIRTYRKDFAPKVPPLWYGLERAAVDTVWSGQPHEYAGVEYRLDDGWLTARLPSGRKLFYWNPAKIKSVAPWTDDDGKAVFKPSFTYEALKMGQWKTIDRVHGGLLAENVVQGLARDQLVHAMLLLEENNFPTVLTVHDEDVVEVPEKGVDERAFAEILAVRPQWAIDMKVPIAVETWAGDRYRK